LDQGFLEAAVHDGDGTWRPYGETREVFRSPFLVLKEHGVITPDGREATYGVVHCGECVGVLPFVDEDHVLMVRQHRFIAGRWTWEMPTGGVHTGETAEQAAQRELAEEAGFHAGDLQPICTYHTSKSSIDETAHLFIGRALVAAEAPADDAEQIERRQLPFAEVLAMVLDGTITDSMTVIAVLWAARTRS
jgi:ADP-ribose pyrophosphatase